MHKGDEPMSDAELLEPSIDPNTRKISYRHLAARNDGGSKTVVTVRDTPEIVIDEPTERGGTNMGSWEPTGVSLPCCPSTMNRRIPITLCSTCRTVRISTTRTLRLETGV